MLVIYNSKNTLPSWLKSSSHFSWKLSPKELPASIMRTFRAFIWGFNNSKFNPADFNLPILEIAEKEIIASIPWKENVIGVESCLYRERSRKKKAKMNTGALQKRLGREDWENRKADISRSILSNIVCQRLKRWKGKTFKDHDRQRKDYNGETQRDFAVVSHSRWKNWCCENSPQLRRCVQITAAKWLSDNLNKFSFSKSYHITTVSYYRRQRRISTTAVW